MRRVKLKRKVSESPPLNAEAVQALVDQNTKPLLEKIEVLEKKVEKATTRLDEVMRMASLVLASDGSTKERLEEFLSTLSAMDKFRPTALVDVLRRDMNAALNDHMFAALRGNPPPLAGAQTARQAGDLRAAELRAIAQQYGALHPSVQSLQRRFEADDMVENVSEDDDMPDLSD